MYKVTISNSIKVTLSAGFTEAVLAFLTFCISETMRTYSSS